MVLEFFKGHKQSGLDFIQDTLVGMLEDGHDVFVTACNALFGGGKSKATKREVRRTDHEINEAQREVRRHLMVHAAVNNANLPVVLQYASIVKDAERVGDYAKNIYDLVKYGANFDVVEDRDELEHYRDAVAQLILDAAEVFAHKDTEQAQHLIGKADGFLSEYDARVKEAYNSDGPASHAVARALYFRFLKRTTAHVMNVLTSLVQPLDRLDSYDEAPEDRI
ncbi:MAG: PhoU domain-containing protein [Acidimicrobiia bacterium]